MSLFHGNPASFVSLRADLARFHQETFDHWMEYVVIHGPRETGREHLFKTHSYDLASIRPKKFYHSWAGNGQHTGLKEPCLSTPFTLVVATYFGVQARGLRVEGEMLRVA